MCQTNCPITTVPINFLFFKKKERKREKKKEEGFIVQR